MNDEDLWELVRETGRAVWPHYQPVLERILENTGLDGRSMSLLVAVLTIEPDTTTPAHLLIRNPYTSAEQYFARLAHAARLDYLGEVSQGDFRMTPEGRRITQQFIDEARYAMADADPLPLRESQRLAGLLGRLVQSSLETAPPPNPWSIGLSFKLMPSFDPPLPYTEQAISCLMAYRDDAHLAAWRGTGLSATALETLTLIWRSEVDSVPELVDQLAHRGHSKEVYADAVTELQERGFIEASESQLRITTNGQSFREQVEHDTQSFFFAPWSQLSDAEKSEVRELSLQMRDGLRASAPEPQSR
ncbi:MAG TPA: hypothetical protein VE136_06755 [Anaerolineales bacterium]|jgi:hypothetical protein|nr:hypothetical protein [Anaerolineales bacterium]